MKKQRLKELKCITQGTQLTPRASRVEYKSNSKLMLLRLSCKLVGKDIWEKSALTDRNIRIFLFLNYSFQIIQNFLGPSCSFSQAIRDSLQAVHIQ